MDLFEIAASGDTVLRGDTVLNPLGNRMLRGAVSNWGFTSHGLHTMGIMAGNGWASLNSIKLAGSTDTMKFRGVAPKAMILSDRVHNQMGRGDVNNHSFVANFRSIYCDEADVALSNHDNSLPIFTNFNNIGVYAAANNGVSNGQSVFFQTGYYSLLQCNKNGIIVGATETSLPLRIARFSSLGPTRDGRIKPDVVAPGIGLQHESLIIEFDSIAIKNNTGGIKHSWNFNDGTEGFGTLDRDFWQVIDTSRSGGVFRFITLSNPYFSINPIATSDTLITNSTDSIFIRLRVLKNSLNIPNTILLARLYWHNRNSSSYVDGNTPWDQNINTDSVWVNISLPALWGNSDTLGSFRLDFSFHESKIVSLESPNEYVGKEGTSMASPHVAGISALMLQKYNEDVIHARNNSGMSLNIHQNNCWNSTVRAILIHTATDLVDTVGIVFPANPEFAYHSDYRSPLYGKGPDWVTGWGLVNAVKALDYMDTTKFIEDTIGEINLSDTFFIYVPIGTSSLKTTLAWDDCPGFGHQDTIGAYLPKLINDLDLHLVHVNTGTVYRPWILDHSPLNDGLIHYGYSTRIDTLIRGIDTSITPTVILTNQASRNTGRRDSLNNVEVVEVDNPLEGIWKIVVDATAIGDNQTLPAVIGNNRQDYSLIHDFPIIRDTATSNWRVSSSGAGDVRAISDAIALASSGDSITVSAGSYTVSTPDSTNGITLILNPGVTINFADPNSFIYVGTNGRIVGAENITLHPQIVLYNTPSAREPLPIDNVIGLFGNLCRAIGVSTPGKTIMTGPGEYSMTSLSYEGLIGVMDADRARSSIIRLGFQDAPTCPPEPPQPPSLQKTLLMNMRFETPDNGQNSALTVFGDEELEFRNCTFENHDTDGTITSNMVAVGDSNLIRNGVTRFTKCIFSNYKNAVVVRSCTTQTQSPFFTNTVFENCSTDIAFPANAQSFCRIEANQLHTISVGTQRYTGATTINNLITTTCSGGSLAKRNISLANIALVDEVASDLRPSTRSSLIDNGIDNEDIGVTNTDLVYTFSHFLDAEIIFPTGDTIILNNGVLTKNTIGSDVLLKPIYTLNLRPVNQIVITSNYIDHSSQVKLTLNSIPVPVLPSDYVVFDVKINGYTFDQLTFSSIPTVGDSIFVDVTPDNISPAPVANVAATASGSDALVTWSSNTDPDIRRYKVYRSLAGTPLLPKQIGSVSKYTTSFTDPGNNPIGFIYNVVAYDSTGNQSYNYPAVPMRVDMKDIGYNEINITKPQLIITNNSTESLSGFKVRVWFSRAEFQGKEIIADRYYMDPSTITLSKGVHPLNSNIVYVELGYPSNYQLAPGASTPSQGVQFGVHFTNYYPGQWNKSNDWSYQGISGSFISTQQVTVYNKDGILLFGNEPLPNSVPLPPVIPVASVFGFESCDGWSVSQGTMSIDNTFKTQGISSVNFQGGGYQEIISTDLSTVNITGETATLKLDVYVGTIQPNPYYVGSLQLYVNCPSGGIANTLIAQKELTPLSIGAFNTLTFTIPTNILNVLRGSYTDFSFKIIMNTNSSSGPYKLDNFRF